ncbi:MAG: hypothetical protein U9R72_10830, partial [Chloroflexota bacterium]|nr:hypothetical protein [Chloroflexota bacterium]
MNRRWISLTAVTIMLAVSLVGPQSSTARDQVAATHTIEEARALPDGTTDVTVRGRVSTPVNVFASYELWMQDDTAGIDVYRYAGL